MNARTWFYSQSFGTPAPQSKAQNCPLVTGMRPCQCDLPRCSRCSYTDHDARFELDHTICERQGGVIPASKESA